MSDELFVDGVHAELYPSEFWDGAYGFAADVLWEDWVEIWLVIGISFGDKYLALFCDVYVVDAVEDEDAVLADVLDDIAGL